MKENTLSVLGLTDEEHTIYRMLCSEQSLTLAGIAKKTGIHRPRLYMVLPTMVKNNLVSERMIGKRTYYRPAEPRFLYELIKKRTNEMVDVIESLQNTYEETAKKPDIEFYIGKGGYKKMFDDIADVVPKGGQIMRYTARRPDDTTYHVSPSYRERRNKGHFERLAITSARKGAKANLKRLDKFVKIIPPSFDEFEDHVSQTIYEDRVVFTDHEQETVFIIKSERIATVQKKLFKLLWKYLPEPKQN